MDVPAWVIAASGLVVVSVLLMFWAIAGMGRTGTAGAARTLGIEPSTTDQRQLQLQTPAWERFLRPWIDSVSNRIRRLTPVGWVEALEHRLKLAGSPRRWPVQRVLGVKLILGIITLLVTLLTVNGLSIVADNISATLGRFALAIALAVMMYFMPDLIIAGRARERQATIQRDLSDTMDQMTISVEAGLGFDAALQRVVQSGEGPLTEELHRTLNEIAIGITRREAFQNLLERTDVQELRHFVFAVTQAEQYGVPIANVLKVQARELRVMRRQRAEERAMKIPVLIVLPLVLCILPALFVVILVPAAIRVFEVLL